MSTATAARARLSDVLSTDRAAPLVLNETYPTSSGVAGSTLYDWLTGGAAAGGIAVSERAALSVSAVFACVSIIAGAIAGFPFHLYRRAESGRERYESDLWWLFNESPSPAWSSASAWEYAVMNVLLQGDGFWQIHRASKYSNTIVGFEPHHRLSVEPKRVEGRNKYIVTPKEGARFVIDQDDMLHFPGLGFDGISSLTPLQYALRNGAGIAAAADKSAADFFRTGARSELFLSSAGKVSPEQQEQLRERWKAKSAGAANAIYPVILQGDWKAEKIGLSAADAQLIETRQFQVEDICRIYGVPPHMVAKTDASTSWGSGIEAMGTGFVRFTLRAHLNRISQEINRKVWPRSRLYYGEHNVDALMEGDSTAQATYFAKALGGPGAQGWMAANEVRKLKNLPPLSDPRASQVQFAGSAKTQGTKNA